MFRSLHALALLVGASVSGALHQPVDSSSCPVVSNDGTPTGEFRNVSGIQIYYAYPASYAYNRNNAIIYISDIYGVPLLQNRLLADSLASAVNVPVIFPDLFRGDAIPSSSSEAGLNLTEWRTRHTTADVDAVITQTISYIKNQLGVKRLGAVGYCFGGKYVPRFLAAGKGIDVGFIAHPSSLEAAEIQGIAGPISIAAGELDQAFNVTLRRNAEDILTSKNATYQTTLYSGAPHGFGVRVDLTVPRQAYAKQASFLQAVGWIRNWL